MLTGVMLRGHLAAMKGPQESLPCTDTLYYAQDRPGPFLILSELGYTKPLSGKAGPKGMAALGGTGLALSPWAVARK